MATQQIANEQVATAIVDPRPSRPHVWGPGEQAEYDALRARGRTLYDNLRTQFDWTHADAFARAAAEFGLRSSSCGTPNHPHFAHDCAVTDRVQRLYSEES